MTGGPLLERLRLGVDRLVERADALSDEVAHRDPTPEDWSVARILSHVVEFVPYWAAQAKAIASHPTDGLPFGRSHDDPGRLAAVETHAATVIRELTPRVKASLDQGLRTLAEIRPDHWKRTGRHPRLGELSVAQVVERFLIDHVEEHIAQIEQTATATAAAAAVKA